MRYEAVFVDSAGIPCAYGLAAERELAFQVAKAGLARHRSLPRNRGAHAHEFRLHVTELPDGPVTVDPHGRDAARQAFTFLLLLDPFFFEGQTFEQIKRRGPSTETLLARVRFETADENAAEREHAERVVRAVSAAGLQARRDIGFGWVSVTDPATGATIRVTRNNEVQSRKATPEHDALVERVRAIPGLRGAAAAELSRTLRWEKERLLARLDAIDEELRQAEAVIAEDADHSL